MCGRKIPAAEPRPRRVDTNERAPGTAVGGRRNVGRGCETASGHSAAGALPSLCLFFLFLFRRSAGKEIREPYYDGNSGLGQEREICKTHRGASCRPAHEARVELGRFN